MLLTMIINGLSSTLVLALESAVSYDGQNRRGSSRAPVILMLSCYEEIQTGVERERLERLMGGGPPRAPVILKH